MRYAGFDSIKDTYWYSFRDDAIQTSPLFFPRLTDPSIVLPSESPDGLWHLFAHTWMGIMHYISTSGLNWEKRRLVTPRGNSPFIYRENNTYFMVYETHDTFRSRKKVKDVTKKGSRIMLSSSFDLMKWSEPRVILEAKDISGTSYRMRESRVSRPNLVYWEGRYRLYFGAGDTRIYDSHQKTTVSFMMAESDNIDGPYKPYNGKLVTIDPDSRYRNLATGGIRVVPLADALVAFESSYYYDVEENRSRCALLLLSSLDGIAWKDEKVILSSPLQGWSSRAITGCDAKYIDAENTWYCYYSASERLRLFGLVPFVRESLGLIFGKN